MLPESVVERSEVNVRPEGWNSADIRKGTCKLPWYLLPISASMLYLQHASRSCAHYSTCCTDPHSSPSPTGCSLLPLAMPHIFILSPLHQVFLSERNVEWALLGSCSSAALLDIGMHPPVTWQVNHMALHALFGQYQMLLPLLLKRVTVCLTHSPVFECFMDCP